MLGDEEVLANDATHGTVGLTPGEYGKLSVILYVNAPKPTNMLTNLHNDIRFMRDLLAGWPAKPQTQGSAAATLHN